jgi:hypothetical protein
VVVESAIDGENMTEASQTSRSAWNASAPLLVGLVVAVVAAWFVVPRAAPASEAGLVPTVEVGTLDNPAPVGDVLDGPLRVKVSDAEWSGSTLILNVQIANTTDQPRQVRPADFQARNPITEAAFPAVAGAPLTDPLRTTTLGPGEITHGQIGFAATSSGVDALILDQSSGSPRAWELYAS